ncbi:hypothetical protein SAMN05720765_101115 [Fibrobacter sp. UWH6]|nr:hypothetical protein SAMN05720765_101115 [Fibrobacter sp. UWH6]
MVLFAFFAISIFADPTVSIFVKDASEIENLRADLSELKECLGEENEALNKLIEQANRIGIMNDRCPMLSINDILDDSCGKFYAVELPESEANYMEVTGEIRLGSMTMSNNLEQRTQQIDACAEAPSAAYKISSTKEN